MLNKNDAIRIEHIKYRNDKGFIKSSRKIYVFICVYCKKEEIRPEEKYLKKHSGKCKFCTHKGIPYLAGFNYFKNAVLRTNKKRKKQKSFNLTFSDFLKFVEIKKCHYCNKPIKWVEHTGKGQHRCNLDRKDSNIGYSVDNCVVCCKECNILKGEGFSYEEFKAVVSLLDKMRNNSFIFKDL